MNNILKTTFENWFTDFICIDLTKKISSNDLYEHYCKFADEKQILPLRKKTFVKECRILLQELEREGRVEFFYTNCINFRGVGITETEQNQETIEFLASKKELTNA